MAHIYYPVAGATRVHTVVEFVRASNAETATTQDVKTGGAISANSVVLTVLVVPGNIVLLCALQQLWFVDFFAVLVGCFVYILVLSCVVLAFARHICFAHLDTVVYFAVLLFACSVVGFSERCFAILFGSAL